MKEALKRNRGIVNIIKDDGNIIKLGGRVCVKDMFEAYANDGYWSNINVKQANEYEKEIYWG